MEGTTLYDLIEVELLRKWRKRIEQEEVDTCFFTSVEQALSELEQELNEQQKKLLKSYCVAIENKLDYINLNLSIKTLNFGIKIGMELEKAFATIEDNFLPS